MTRVTRRADCGNSPKNLLVEALAIAIEAGRAAEVARLVSDDVRWLRAGEAAVDGKDPMLATLATPARGTPSTVVIEHALTHGRAGACDGTATFADGTALSFCHVFDFASVKGDRVSRITSYLVALA